MRKKRLPSPFPKLPQKSCVPFLLFAPQSNIKRGVDPLAFLVGPVLTRYGGDPSNSSVVDLSRYIDNRRKIVRSITGQIELNHGVGLCTLDAPKAQGVTGFLDKAGPITLNSIAVRSRNQYATLMVVSMDDLPLRDSRKILVQVGTIARPYGWKTRERQFTEKRGGKPVQGKTILDRGSAPWNVANAEITLTVRNRNITKAILLDPNGRAIRDIPSRRDNHAFTVELPAKTMYAVLR